MSRHVFVRVDDVRLVRRPDLQTTPAQAVTTDVQPQEQPISQDEQGFERARTLLHLNRSHEALKIAGSLVAGNPQDGRAWALVAACQLAAGEQAAAEDSVRRTLALGSDNVGVLIWASHVMSTAGKRNLALDLAEEAVRLAPELAKAHAALATRAADIAPKGAPSCLDHFLWQQARRHAHEALRLDPQGVEGTFARAYVDLRSGQYRAARRGFRAVLAIDPADQAAQNNLAVLEMQRLRLNRAARSFLALAADDPGGRKAVRNVGRVVSRQVALAHALLWLLYGSSVVAAALAAAGPARDRWTWRSLAACVGIIALIGFVARSWQTAPRGLRDFATRRLLSRGERWMVLCCDAAMLSLVLFSAVAVGAAAWEVPMAGLTLCVPVAVVLVRAGSRAPR